MSRSNLFWWTVLVLVAGALGAVALMHPVAGWLPGQARKSPSPPVLGAAGIAVPCGVMLYGAWRAWFELSLLRAARQAERARAARRSA